MWVVPPEESTMSSALPSSKSRRLRPAAAQGLAGASSLLRLSLRAPQALPSRTQLSGWFARAGSRLAQAPADAGPSILAA